MAAVAAMWSAAFAGAYIGWILYGGTLNYFVVNNFAAMGGMGEAYLAIGGFVFVQAFCIGEESRGWTCGAYFRSELAALRGLFARRRAGSA
jgi:hypothetical protein